METLLAPPSGHPRPDVPPLVAVPFSAQPTRSLLPPLLDRPAAFLWFWVLPVAVLFLLNLDGYQLIEGSMSAGQRSQARELGAAGIVNLLIGFGLFAVARRVANRSIALGMRVAFLTGPAVFVQVAYLWFAAASMNDLLPSAVTAWIYPESRFLFNQFSFAMLPLFFGILHLACAPTKVRSGRTLAVGICLIVGAPAMVYLIGHGLRLWGNELQLAGVVMATAIVAAGIALFVAVLRGLMFALRAAQRGGVIVERVAIVIVALLLPLGGLALNRAIPFPVDFQAWEVYALTVANAAVLLFASVGRERWPRVSFGLLSAALPFSLYFFFVFLPYTPLSIFAVLFFGAGFLVLTPTLLCALHLYGWNQARLAAARTLPLRSQIVIGALCFCVLPLSFVGRARSNRVALNAALDHVYAPAITGREIVYPRSLTELRRALNHHRDYKNGIYYPLLSDFYAWYVFNHLVLPDDKLARLERTFFGTSAATGASALRNTAAGPFGRSRVRERHRMPRATTPSRSVPVRELTLRRQAVDATSTTVTMSLVLENRGPAAGEFVQTLPLPPGVFVQGFRLWIDGAPVAGRIFEEKSARWVYTMIRDFERRDPGLLFYRTSDELELRVFPVAAQGTARVELDFLVPVASAAFELPAPSHDPALVLRSLGAHWPARRGAGADGTVVAGEFTTALPDVTREPYLHLIVDRSADNAFTGDLGTMVAELRERVPAARRVRVTLVNFDLIDLVPELSPLDGLRSLDARRLDRTLPVAGGFSLDVALAHALRRHRDADLDVANATGGIPPRPVFVILSGAAGARALDLRLTENWLDLEPRCEVYESDPRHVWITQWETGPVATPLLRLGASVRPLAPNRLLRFAATQGANGLSYWSRADGDWRAAPEIATPPANSAWARAVGLQLQQQDFARSPGGARTDLRALVAASRDSGVLIGGTSYIVVEQAAQWRLLERSEKQTLGQNAALDFLETPAPPAWWIAIGFGAWLLARRQWRAARPT